LLMERAMTPLSWFRVARDLFRDVRRAGPRLDPAAAAGAERLGAPPRPESWTGQICAVLLTDVVDFATRTDQDGKVIREAMYRIVRDAFNKAGISPGDYGFGDRGDGILVVVSPKVPTKQLVHPFLTRAAEELSRHNATAAGGTQFKLRVALHVGPVESDAEGVNGQVIVEAARLIAAHAFKDRLAQAPPETCLGLIASEFVYNNVIKQHPSQLTPGKYRPITARVKEHEFTAWIKLAPDPRAVSGQPDP
jgi:class 3 adenylate cyclase